MTDESRVWAPDIGSRLAVLRSEIQKPGTDNVELPIQNTPVDCHLGMETGGSVWMRITCDPTSVSTDDQAAAVRVRDHTERLQGHHVSDGSLNVTDHLLDEMVQLLDRRARPRRRRTNSPAELA